MVDLTRRIAVHEGRDGSDINPPRRKAHWRGTVAEYWDLHAYLSLADMRGMLAALDRDAFHNTGGTVAALAYVVRPDAS